MYIRKRRITARQQSKLIEQFVVGSTARSASEIVGVQANTAIRFFMRLRQLITSKLPSYRLHGEVEADESYFCGVRKGKRGRGAGGTVAVFGLLKGGGKVYTAMIPNAKTKTLLPIIQEKVEPDSIVDTDTFRAYNALDIPDFHHRRINHSKLFADKQTTSTGSRTSGTKPSATCVNTTASNRTIFTGSYRSVSGASTEAIIQTS